MEWCLHAFLEGETDRNSPPPLRHPPTRRAGPFETRVHVDPANVEDGMAIHRLAARAAIRDFEDKTSFMHNDDGSLVASLTAADVRIATRTRSLASGTSD